MIPPLFAIPILPVRCVIGVQEKLSFVGEREVARTVNGRAVILQPAYGSLYAVELSNSGKNVWLPHRFEIGQQVRFASTIWQTTIIGRGQTEVVLPRDAMGVTARAAQSSGITVAIANAGGRRWTLAGPAPGPVAVMYRLLLDLVVADFQSSGSATGREQSWTLKLEELGG